MVSYKKNWYTIYNAHNDDVVAFGTMDDCARMMGRTKNAIAVLVNRTREHKNLSYTIVVEDLLNGKYSVYGADHRGADGDRKSFGRRR